MRLKEIRFPPFWLLVLLATMSACHSPTPGASEAGQSAGDGHVVYLQPGHFVEECADPGNILNQLILNAINWQ